MEEKEQQQIARNLYVIFFKNPLWADALSLLQVLEERQHAEAKLNISQNEDKMSTIGIMSH